MNGLGQKIDAPMTFDVAADRFWEEVGKYYNGNARETFEASIWWLVGQIGANTLLPDITSQVVAKAVARRRGEFAKNRTMLVDGERVPRRVTNSTVNRTVTEPLRAILSRARKIWLVPVAEINWANHRLKEPKERVREASIDEEDRILAVLPADYQIVVRFALASGCRLAEVVGLLWSDIDWGERQITVRGKGDKVDRIPLTAGMRELLFPLQDQHETKVFTYACRKKRGARQVGDRLPVTYEGLKTTWRRSLAKSGVTDFRFHDNRHTAATRLLRAGANLKHVQHLLRHEDIATTTKYAHVTNDDLRDAMDAQEARHAAARSKKSPKIPEIAPGTEIEEAASAVK
ncbi:integrase [Methylobacterium gnaphalii]|uniref:Integrase n=2 Tax=Methylobacterium gnaphalii TaxID=1010610 RepID=A0A512JP18_9HYPH|nr:integrase [Methylobacterium gnaphalii]GLS50202.1 integrase [Methylobacterium gnaphalii]